MNNNKINLDHITLGVCYYPEHWDESLWLDDLKRMKEYGIEVIRIAEFAWSFFEPREGEFTFDFFDRFMDLAAKEGIKVVFCTPGATPPAWMTENYPEILNADVNGNLIAHGMRRHYNLNSPTYRSFLARITEKLAEHYSRYDNIIAWQLDNEVNCECSMYFSESDDIAFREFLKNRFGTLDALNKAIGSVFWNQTYTEWDEVHLPGPTNYGHHTNPHMALLYKRFISETVFTFFKMQADIIRKYTKAAITTNGLFEFVDYQRLVNEVFDYVTFDNYPNFAYDLDVNPSHDSVRDRNSSYNMCRIRAVSPIFGIMEQQSGPGGWNFRMAQSAPKPGQLRLWTMQAIAHGADFVSYFRWRTCTFGTEIYWHGLNDYCNRPNRRTDELQKTYADIKQLKGVCGNDYVAEAAVLFDYDNEWDANEDIWHRDVTYLSNDGWFRALQKKHIPYDMVYINDQTELEKLSKYKLVVYPHPTIFNQKRADLLKAYAEQGGAVIFGCRTGYKDLNGICYMEPMPCHAAPLCGAEVEDFTFLSPYDEQQTVTIAGQKVSAPCFNDILRVTDGSEVACFENNYYAGKCALSVKQIGNGKVYYFGGGFAEDTAKAFISLVGLSSPMQLDKTIELPESVELAIRGNAAFLLNYADQPIEFACSKSYTDLITGKQFTNKIAIDGYGVVALNI